MIYKLKTLWLFLKNSKTDIELFAIILSLLSPFILLWVGNKISEDSIKSQHNIATLQMIDNYMDGIDDLILRDDKKSDNLIISRSQVILKGMNVPKYSSLIIRYISEVGRYDLFDHSNIKDDNTTVWTSKYIDLQSINLENQNLTNVYLKGAMLVNANFTNAYLMQTYFHEAILLNTNFTKALFINTFYEKTYSAKTIFSEAMIINSHFSDSNFNNADFTNATLKNTDCNNTNFEGANFKNTIFNNVDFSYANLLNTRNLTIKQLSKVKSLFQAKLPIKLKEQIIKKYPHLLKNHSSNKNLEKNSLP